MKYKSKYLDIYDKVKSDREGEQKASIIDEVDFELELIRRDNINVAYILALLASIGEEEDDEAGRAQASAKKKAVLDLLGSEARLRSKRELIEEFIASYLTIRRTGDETRDAFNEYWDEKREQAFKDICSEEGLDPDGFSRLMQSYQFTQKEPLADDVLPVLKEPVGILQRKSVITRVIDRLKGFIETFDENMGDIT
ncbi:hypothetical protein Q4560_16930 [Celeribacter halophilus]|uniref:type I restriction endonuclease subunit R, EcoR124 family n=1 Tax=Celeribacter halophilus TaxID=576117 RepID=UPI0026E22A34|nr:hypothetical protein [Celeribacter halophilus]MDO6724954.1 hypothetical protein [Celeribacter halophilus]